MFHVRGLLSVGFYLLLLCPDPLLAALASIIQHINKGMKTIPLNKKRSGRLRSINWKCCASQLFENNSIIKKSHSSRVYTVSFERVCFPARAFRSLTLIGCKTRDYAMIHTSTP